jgi:hypothetical protein
VVNVVVAIVVSIDIARAFGKGPGFGWGLAFLGFIFFPILGFGGASYEPTGSREKIADLGVSVVNNYLGRGINVGFGVAVLSLDFDLGQAQRVESVISRGCTERRRQKPVTSRR